MHKIVKYSKIILQNIAKNLKFRLNRYCLLLLRLTAQPAVQLFEGDRSREHEQWVKFWGPRAPGGGPGIGKDKRFVGKIGRRETDERRAPEEHERNVQIRAGASEKRWSAWRSVDELEFRRITASQRQSVGILRRRSIRMPACRN